MRLTRLVPLLAACWTVPVLGGSLPTELVSRTDIAAHIEADGSATGPAGVSASGRFVLFISTASNLVDGDRNGIADLFLHDLDTGATERANVASDGNEADAPALFRAGVSDDGRYVVFSSTAATLATEPTFGVAQVYRRDRVAGTTQLLSRGGNGLAGSSSSTAGNLSADGRYSVFSSSAANLSPTLPAFHEQIYRHDAVSNTLELVSAATAGTPGSHMSWNPQVSDDGRYVLFLSFATDLVVGDTNAGIDLFLRDMQLGTTQRVSVSSNGSQVADLGSIEFFLSCSVNLMSSDGRYVVFATEAPADPTDTNGAPDIYRFDRVAGTTQRISHAVGAVAPYINNLCPTISGDGERIAWWSHAGYYMPGTSALYLRDLGAGTLRPLLAHVMPTPLFSGSTLALPGDGGGLFFASNVLMPGSRYSQLYRFDTDSNLLARLGGSLASAYGPFANDHSNDTMQWVGVGGASASADGRYVAFASQASNLVVADTNSVADIFLRDRMTGTTQRISTRSDGSQSDCTSATPSIDSDGRYIAFTSCGALAAPASGAQREVYRYDRITAGIELISVGPAGQRTNGDSYDVHASDDGRIVGFVSCATNLLAAATTDCQAFARDMLADTTQLISRTATGLPADRPVRGLRVAGSGRYVLFNSTATNLVAGDTNDQFDVFTHDRVSQTTQRVSIASDGSQGNSASFLGNASSSGRRIVFTSMATTLAPGTTPARNRVYLRDLDALTTSLVAIPGDSDKSGSWPSLSGDGTRVVFINSSANSGMSSYNDSGRQKIYLFDQPSGSYRALTWFERAGSDTFTDTPRLTADGTKIVFDSTRADLVKEDGNGAFTDVFLLHLADVIFADSFEAPARPARMP
jgi:Tol biopolymer transport system component